MRWLCLVAVLVLPGVAAPVRADDPPKKLLMVTHAGSFVHESAAVAEQVMKEIGPKNGFAVTCYRFTNDPDARVKIKRKKTNEVVEVNALEEYSRLFREKTGEVVTKEQCGRVNAETLKKFDVVLFFTTGAKNEPPAPLTDDELKDLLDWVRNGGAFAGSHCASDTLYGTPYGDLVGAFFKNHPWKIVEFKLRCEDPKHPAAKALPDGSLITDEIYQFLDTPYSRDKLHIIHSVVNSSIDLKKGQRQDQDYAISWCLEYGKGKSFYTALGHRKEVWQDPRFQEHLIAGMKWSLGLLPGDATPTSKLKK